MFPERLAPQLELLHQEYVLIQAWKKTAKYIRYHNWFSDTLAVDRVAVNLPAFLGEIRERLQSPVVWQNDPLRIVLAPKSQHWRVRQSNWEPAEKGARSLKLRPLAHVSLADQVAATAIVLCLADRVETWQGDPRWPIRDQQSRKKVISYGNRLFCDESDGILHHRWGSTKLYRAYYMDYRMFLSRPEVVAESFLKANKWPIYVIHADIKQFYDRVRPALLASAIDRIRRDDDDPAFFELAVALLDWSWDPRDQRNEIPIYIDQTGIEDFTRVALPQGLVASGFLANVVLLSFDEALRAAIGTEITHGILLADACRYVDDMRILIAVDPDKGISTGDLQKIVLDNWLEPLLKDKAPHLELSSDPLKRKIAAFGGDERPLVRQSAKMNRIQSAVSGGFDALAGEEILDAIQGLMRAQEALSMRDDSGWRLSPVPDVGDETVARFGAARFRITFRSIRPLLEDEATIGDVNSRAVNVASDNRVRVARTRRELDDDARSFALALIQRWIEDPSNVRLLRIGLDLWPDVKLLHEVLSFLRPFTEKGLRRGVPKRVAWYCLSELFRAGATETGIVFDQESLPSDIDLKAYRVLMSEEAARLVGSPGHSIPWYLRQQALLFLAAFDPGRVSIARISRAPERRHYDQLIRFLCGRADGLSNEEFAILAILARRSFMDRVRAIELTKPCLNPARMRQLAQRDPSFLLELIETETQHRLFDKLPARVREDLYRADSGEDDSGDGTETLADVVRCSHPNCSLRNELSLLRFARMFLEKWQHDNAHKVITAGQVKLSLTEDHGVAEVRDVRVLGSRADTTGSLFEVPGWCKDCDRWRFQLGFLLQFMLSGQADFTRLVRPAHWKETESVYRPAESHRIQRLYGLYSGQPAFGDDWLPITDWVEGFILALLRWPGCHPPDGFDYIEHGIEDTIVRIGERIEMLEQRRGRATSAILLPIIVKRPTVTTTSRPLRACVVQTAIPTTDDFQHSDLSLNNSAIRRRHRNHLSSALAAVERMLALRETHKGQDGRLDWLILPELASHPDDIRTHLIPFARAHRTIILTGLTYERLLSGQPLINSALWIIPEWSDAYGLQIRTRRQGKAHLARNEQTFNSNSTLLQGFRPCQWLVGYPWSVKDQDPPLWLTAAVCYDATDIRLAADLTGVSDVLAIPAFNMDVKTFDQMALALHYHMFQLVVVANSGQYGGSNAYLPKKKEYLRQVFHMHGQPQASIAFFEIDDIGAYLQRYEITATGAGDWKYPPAGTDI